MKGRDFSSHQLYDTKDEYSCHEIWPVKKSEPKLWDKSSDITN